MKTLNTLTRASDATCDDPSAFTKGDVVQSIFQLHADAERIAGMAENLSLDAILEASIVAFGKDRGRRISRSIYVLVNAQPADPEMFDKAVNAPWVSALT